MKKSTLTLPQNQWGSLVTKFPPNSSLVGPDVFTNGSKNFNTDINGVITKRKGGLLYGTLGGPAKDQFEAIFSDGVRNMLEVDGGVLRYTSGDGIFTPVKEGFSTAGNFEFALSRDRVYAGNGIDANIVYDRDLSYGGAVALPATITINDYTGLGTETVQIGATVLTEGSEWSAATGNDETATSLAAAIDALANITATAEDNVITILSDTPSIVQISDDTDMSMAGVSGRRIRPMGATPPTAALTANEGITGDVPAGDYLYKVTFVYYDDEESNGGPATGVLTLSTPPSQIDLTDIPIGGYGVTARRIYRSDDEGDTYRLVVEVANNTDTIATDNESVGIELIPEDNNIPPTFSLVMQHTDRLWIAGISGDMSTLAFSDAGFPDIFPADFYVVCNPTDPITGLAVYNGRPIVFNQNSFGQILGSTPDAYRYDQVPGGIGCVDCRSIQIRTIRGVPVLIWMSDRGVYGYNGSTVEYLSDSIEDLLNVNVQQASYTRGSHTDTVDADFNAGTATPAITVAGGAVAVDNPKKTWQTQDEWEEAEDMVNVATNATASQLANRIGTPKGKSFSYSTEGSVTEGAPTLAPTSITLPVGTDFTGETKSATTRRTLSNSAVTSLAYPFVLARGGTATALKFDVSAGAGAAFNYRIKIWSDSIGSPGAEVYASSIIASGAPAFGIVVLNINHSLSAALSAGTYWFGFERESTSGALIFNKPDVAFSGGEPKIKEGSWVAPSYNLNLGAGQSVFYTFVQSAVPLSAEWRSPVVDTGLFENAAAQTVYLNASATYPTGATTSTVIVEQSDDTFFTIDETLSENDINGSASLGFALTKRYYRVRVQLATTDDRIVPTVNTLSIGFGQDSLWTSENVDHTTDITELTSITIVASLPAGTSADVVIMKSTDGSAFDDESTVALSNGSQTLDLTAVNDGDDRYTRIRFELHSNADIATAVAQIVSAILKWEVVATLVSEPIDTGTATPAGWDVFQTESTGAIVFQMRSAAAEMDLDDAEWVTVASGQFPIGVPLLQFVQYQFTLTAVADLVPVVTSVTINWFTSAIASIRVASMFFNKTYYLSVAEYNQTHNNIVLTFDESGKWHVYRGVNASTMGLFFQRPHYGDSVESEMIRFLEGLTDSGDNIEMVVRTKAFDFNDITRRKALRSVTVTYLDNGAEFTVNYSIDGGLSFLPLVDENGDNTWTTGTTGVVKVRRLAPDGANEIQGKTIMVEIVNDDENYSEVHNIQIDAYVREGDILNG